MKTNMKQLKKFFKGSNKGQKVRFMIFNHVLEINYFISPFYTDFQVLIVWTSSADKKISVESLVSIWTSLPFVVNHIKATSVIN